jgi:hypothetical protein
MSCVFKNIDPPPPSQPGECTPAFVAGGGHTRRVERGVGVNILQRWAAQHVFQVHNAQFHSFVIVVRKAQLRSVSKFESAQCAMRQLRILPLCTITVRKK